MFRILNKRFEVFIIFLIYIKRNKFKKNNTLKSLLVEYI